MVKEKNAKEGPFVRLLFLLYVGLMMWLLFVQRMDAGGTAIDDNWNFVPFKTLKLYWKLIFSGNRYYVIHSVVNLVGNVVMFIPLGIFLPLIWPKLRAFLLLLLFSLFLIIMIEVLQYFTGLGSCDIDDLLLNLPGVVIGFLISKSKSISRP